MTSEKRANPAAELANGVRSSEQVGTALWIQATPTIAIFQATRRTADHRTRLVYAGWVTVRLNDGRRRSIPVLRRRTVPISPSRNNRLDGAAAC